MALPVRRSSYAASRWDPFAALEELHDEMSRLLTNVFPDVGRISIDAWSPPVDVEETDDAYLIEADTPGVRPEDLNVEVQGNELRIIGRIEEGTLRHRTRRAGQFDYRLTLPSDVNPEGAEAELEHGVVKLRLPKTTSAARHRIAIKGVPAEAVSGDEGEHGDQGEQG
jgi:HSP20 family protein